MHVKAGVDADASTTTNRINFTSRFKRCPHYIILSVVSRNNFEVECDDLNRDHFSLFSYPLQVPNNPPKVSSNPFMTAQFLSHLTLPIMRMISLTLLIAVMMLLTMLTSYQSSGNHRPCNPTAQKSRLKGKIKRNIAADNSLSLLIMLSMSVLHAIEVSIYQQRLMN